MRHQLFVLPLYLVCLLWITGCSSQNSGSSDSSTSTVSQKKERRKEHVKENSGVSEHSSSQPANFLLQTLKDPVARKTFLASPQKAVTKITAVFFGTKNKDALNHYALALIDIGETAFDSLLEKFVQNHLFNIQSRTSAVYTFKQISKVTSEKEKKRHVNKLLPLLDKKTKSIPYESTQAILIAYGEAAVPPLMDKFKIIQHGSGHIPYDVRLNNLCVSLSNAGASAVNSLLALEKNLPKVNPRTQKTDPAYARYASMSILYTLGKASYEAHPELFLTKVLPIIKKYAESKDEKLQEKALQSLRSVDTKNKDLKSAIMTFAFTFFAHDNKKLRQTAQYILQDHRPQSIPLLLKKIETSKNKTEHAIILESLDFIQERLPHHDSIALIAKPLLGLFNVAPDDIMALEHKIVKWENSFKGNFDPFTPNINHNSPLVRHYALSGLALKGTVLKDSTLVKESILPELIAAWKNPINEDSYITIRRGLDIRQVRTTALTGIESLSKYCDKPYFEQKVFPIIQAGLSQKSEHVKRGAILALAAYPQFDLKMAKTLAKKIFETKYNNLSINKTAINYLAINAAHTQSLEDQMSVLELIQTAYPKPITETHNVKKRKAQILKEEMLDSLQKMARKSPHVEIQTNTIDFLKQAYSTFHVNNLTLKQQSLHTLTRVAYKSTKKNARNVLTFIEKTLLKTDPDSLVLLKASATILANNYFIADEKQKFIQTYILPLLISEEQKERTDGITTLKIFGIDAIQPAIDLHKRTSNVELKRQLASLLSSLTKDLKPLKQEVSDILSKYFAKLLNTSDIQLTSSALSGLTHIAPSTLQTVLNEMPQASEETAPYFFLALSNFCYHKDVTQSALEQIYTTLIHNTLHETHYESAIDALNECMDINYLTKKIAEHLVSHMINMDTPENPRQYIRYRLAQKLKEPSLVLKKQGIPDYTSKTFKKTLKETSNWTIQKSIIDYFKDLWKRTKDLDDVVRELQTRTRNIWIQMAIDAYFQIPESENAS